MAPFVKFEKFSEDLAKGVHNLHTATLKVFLTNATPNVATHTVKADLAEITAQNGYPAGGSDTQNTVSRTGGVSSVTGTDIVWTASGGAFGPWRYAVLYNDDVTGDPLIGYWDYGSSASTTAPETATVDFGSAQLTVT